MKTGQKMTRAQAERDLRAGTLSPQDVLDDPDGYPNRHVRLQAFKLTTHRGGTEEDLKIVSPAAAEQVAKLQAEVDAPDKKLAAFALYPRWIQKFLTGRPSGEV